MSQFFFSLFKGADAKKLVEVQSNLVMVIQGADNVPKRMSKKLETILKLQWASNLDQYTAAYKLVDPNLPSLVLGSLLLKQVQDLKPFLIENFVKFVISNKGKTQPHILNSLQPLLKSISHEEFKSTLLPPMLKAMLRNPELVLEAFGLILSNLSIDLSQYVQDLSKPFATQLHANDDLTRENAVKCMASLASKSSDSDAIELLLKSIFSVLNGSEGKLSIASHKMSLLSAAAAVSGKISFREF